MAGKQFFMGGENHTLTKEEKALFKKEQEEQAEKDRLALLAEDEKFTVKATSEYNKSLLNIDPKLKDLTLPKGKVLIRLFQAPKVRESGLYIPDTTIIISENTGKPKMESMDNRDTKYYSRAVVVAVGEGVEETLAPGTVVDLYMNAYRNITQYWSPLNRLSIDNLEEPENYFTIPDNQINFIWKTYQM